MGADSPLLRFWRFTIQTNFHQTAPHRTARVRCVLTYRRVAGSSRTGRLFIILTPLSFTKHLSSKIYHPLSYHAAERAQWKDLCAVIYATRGAAKFQISLMVSWITGQRKRTWLNMFDIIADVFSTICCRQVRSALTILTGPKCETFFLWFLASFRRDFPSARQATHTFSVPQKSKTGYRRSGTVFDEGLVLRTGC